MGEGLATIPQAEVYPCNGEAEQSLLAEVMLKPSLADDFTFLKPSDFYWQAHIAVYALILEMRAVGEDVHPIALGLALSDGPGWDVIGEGPTEYLQRIVSESEPMPRSWVKGLATTIYRLARQRDMITLGENIQNDAFTLPAGDSLGAMQSRAINALQDVLPPVETSSSVSAELDRILDRAEDPTRDKSLRVMSGLTDWDRRIGGMRAGELHIIGARPGMGKTIVGANMAVNVALEGKGALYFSMEISREQLMGRILCDLVERGGHELWTRSLRAGGIMPQLVGPLIKARDIFDRLPLIIDEQRGMTLAEIAAKARLARKQFRSEGKDLEIIVVDYMTLIQPADRYKGNKVAEVTELSRGLKILAGELGIPVVALCQLNRNTESRQNQDSKPRLSDLRESGSIEQDADSVTLLFREEYYVLLSEPGLKGTDAYAHWEAKLLEVRDRLEMIVAKNREGETGTVEARVLARCSAVRDA